VRERNPLQEVTKTLSLPTRVDLNTYFVNIANSKETPTKIKLHYIDDVA
jgi:hypothetical protein